ncbi:hypothetical protein CI238_05254 [Colletotrichum incanum]|uniref:Uncharacterized protein n=1 Tax=Colletotrichum incanum TaxID=1573173 RepID=A0A167DYT0_COLIC|nr:hypothetical protein CI238_05254 [Colletotrichum incanum]
MPTSPYQDSPEPGRISSGVASTTKQAKALRMASPAWLRHSTICFSRITYQITCCSRPEVIGTPSWPTGPLARIIRHMDRRFEDEPAALGQS